MISQTSPSKPIEIRFIPALEEVNVAIQICKIRMVSDGELDQTLGYPVFLLNRRKGVGDKAKS